MTEGLAGRTFVVADCLGRGGFGEVYRASMSTQNGLVSDVAIKVLRADVDPAGQAVQRLRDEAALLAALNHPAILKVVDLVVIEGRVALITEFVEGADLSACLAGPDPMPLPALLETIGGVAGALDAAWSWPAPGTGRPLQMVHRDIKPGNIRISRHGAVKLLDFGIARSDEMTREARTQTDLMVGSPAYMAPERFIAAGSPPAADVFALGCCLYEGLVHERFYADLSVPRMSALALDEDRWAAHLDERMGRVLAPAGVVELLRSCLAHDPDVRPTAAAVAARCDELREASPGASLSRWARSRSWDGGPPTSGPLAGRTVTESGVVGPTEPIPGRRPGPTEVLPRADDGAGATTVVAAAPARRIWPWVLSFLVAAIIVGVGTGAVAGGVGLWALWPPSQNTAPASGPATPPAPVATTAEPVVTPPEVASEAVSSPVPPREAPAVAEAPVPKPAPVLRPDAKTTVRPDVPAAVPPVVATARLDLSPKITPGWHLWAMDGDRRVPLPADLAAGSYALFAQYEAGDAVSLGRTSVAAGERWMITCARFLEGTCRVERGSASPP